MPKKLGRRELGRFALSSGLTLGLFTFAGVATSIVIGGCTHGTGGVGPGGATGALRTAFPLSSPVRHVQVWSCFDLPRDDSRSRELSGIAWHEESRTLWAVQDELASIVPIRPDATLERWTFGDAIKLDVTGPLDLEGIAITKDGFLLASEAGPRIIDVDRNGRYRRDVTPPAKFMEALHNKSFESLALDPQKAVLYTTSETALPRDDGAAKDGSGARVRIVRKDLASGEVREHAYAADAVVTGGGDYGVSDLAALATDDLLVLERGFRKGIGNSIRIYRVDLTGSDSVCSAIEQLSSEVAVLSKTLVVDLSKLPFALASTPRQPQPTPLMENYEGIAIGPRLPDGRLALVLVSDDNGSAKQTARVLTLALS